MQCLPIDHGGSDNLTAFLRHIKVGSCSLGGIWDTNSSPLYPPICALVEGILKIIIPDLQQVWEKVIPYRLLQREK